MIAGLDVTTVFVLLFLVQLFLLVVLVVNWFVHRKRFPAAGIWLRAQSALLCGSVLLVLRDIVGLPVSVLAGNVLILVGVSCLLRGIREMFGETFSLTGTWILQIVTAVGLAYFLFVRPDLTARVVIVALAMLLVMVYGMTRLVGRIRRDRLAGAVMFLSYAVTGGALLLRIVMVLVLPRSQNLLDPSPATSVGMIGLLLGNIGWVFGSVLLISQELQEREHRLREQKDLLLRELHHRVKNNLSTIQSLLSLQSHDIEDGQARHVLMDSSSRLLSVQTIYELLSGEEKPGGMRLDDYLTRLAGRIVRTYRDYGVRLVIDVPPVEIDLNTLVPLGLIANELLTNACKYALPETGEGFIRVEFERRDGETGILVVSDDGPGFAPDEDDREAAGLGWRLVRGLTDQLRGEVTIENRGGAVVTVRFPLKTPAYASGD